MLRRSAALTLALAALLSAAAVAPAATTDLTVVLRPAIQQAITHSDITVLAPTSLNLDYSGKLYVSGTGDRRSYAISIAGAPRCGANVCSLAGITGTLGAKATVGEKVLIEKGINGRYLKLSCGASCSPPSIEWVQHNTLYDIQVKTAAKNPKLALIQAARSAIDFGPR